ncbi:MAG: tRNA threonylcarbamoyladenosine dehydratase [Treponema sp.]|nr:tRNA threonylcarbamoyladenosine dehydratase [Treponema sp.]
MEDFFVRTRALIGEQAFSKLQNSHVIVFGVGGVGGYVIEALVRSGIGEITIVDNDVISESNINRQIIALHSTVGKSKVEVMKDRCLDINPLLKIHTIQAFFLPENSNDFDFSNFSYVVDAVDTVTAKIEIIKKAKEAGVPVISSMGTGNKLDPSKFQIADISKTSVCPLARVMRRELKARHITKVKVLFSTEESVGVVTDNSNGRHAPASIAFVPSVGGLMIAGEVVRELTSL